jgi:hypothetical protein
MGYVWHQRHPTTSLEKHLKNNNFDDPYNLLDKLVVLPTGSNKVTFIPDILAWIQSTNETGFVVTV